jgi:hypothetical protein
MKFLMIICHDDSFVSTDALVADIVKWDRDMDARGIRIYGNPLRPASDAVTIQIRDGKRVLKKGPFASSVEKVAAYELIECVSPDDAIEVASSHPMAKAATIEVRPVWSELAK